MTTLARVARAVILVGVLVLGPAAMGKEDTKDTEEAPTIEMCGIPAFDTVFARVAAIDEKLTTTGKLMGDTKRAIQAALSLDSSLSLHDSLMSLKEEAAGKLTVRMTGGVPKLEATDAVPPDVQEAITAVQRMVRGIGASMTELKGIPEEAKGLVTEAAAFPRRIREEAKSASIKASQIPKALKVVKQNIEITAGLPERGAIAVERTTAVLATVGELAP